MKHSTRQRSRVGIGSSWLHRNASGVPFLPRNRRPPRLLTYLDRECTEPDGGGPCGAENYCIGFDTGTVFLVSPSLREYRKKDMRSDGKQRGFPPLYHPVECLLQRGKPGDFRREYQMIRFGGGNNRDARGRKIDRKRIGFSYGIEDALTWKSGCPEDGYQRWER